MKMKEMKETNRLLIEDMPEVSAIVREFMIVSGMTNNVPEAQSKQGRQLIEEENELVAAIQALDKVETFDGIGDVGFVLMSLEILGISLEGSRAWLRGIVYRLGLNCSVLEEAIRVAAVSNLSKFDKTTEEAYTTQRFYESIGVQTSVTKVANLFVVSVSKDCNVEGKPFHAGKILKSKQNFVEADFASMASNYIILYSLGV